MVDVGEKEPTAREAVARGSVHMKPETLRLITQGQVKKGDVLSVARIAGIQATKHTPDLIPLAHRIGVHGAEVDLWLEPDRVRIRATTRTTDLTGVEMEALTAASIALLTLYDMAKALEKGMVIEHVRLLEKTGGKSGDWRAE